MRTGDTGTFIGPGRRTGATVRVLCALLAVATAGCERDGASPEGGTGAAGAAAPPSAGAIEAALAAAEEYFGRGDLAEAEMILDRLVERAPGEGRGRELLGQVLMLKATEAAARGDTEAARAARQSAFEQYEAAVRIDPDVSGLHHSAGTVAMMAGEPAAALAHFERAAALDPLVPQYPLYAAQVLIEQQAHDRARHHLERVLRLDPDEPLAHASLAMIALAEQRHGPALEHIRTARELAPGDLRFRIQEARVHRRGAAPEEAVRLLVGLPPEARTAPGVSYELAESLTDLGRHEEAAAVWAERFAAGSPAGAAHLDATRAGAACARAGRRAEARRWLERAAALAPRSAEVRQLESMIEREP